MNIRPITEDELDSLKRQLQEVGRFIDHQKRFQTQQSGKAVYFVAWEKETSVGHVILYWDSDTPGEPDAVRALHVPRVEDLWVMPEHRGQSISKQLMEQVEELVRSQGHMKIGLDVATDNCFARKLYERRGYQEVGIDEYELSGVNVVDGKEYSWRENCIFLIKNL